MALEWLGSGSGDREESENSLSVGYVMEGAGERTVAAVDPKKPELTEPQLGRWLWWGRQGTFNSSGDYPPGGWWFKGEIGTSPQTPPTFAYLSVQKH